jgi:anti-sigma B factor antagonist
MRADRAARTAARRHLACPRLSWRDSPDAPALEVRDAPLGGAPGVALTGALDLASADELLGPLEEAIHASSGAFVIDLGDLALLDSAGAVALLRARALLGRHERDVLLVCPPGSVLHVLEVAGVAELFAVFASRAAAARHLVPSG